MKNCIVRPVITEKSMNEAAHGKYTFIVHLSANKRMIARDVASLFSVDVLSVATIIVPGKMARSGKKRTVSYASDKKKAIVEIKKGQKIDAFELEQKEGEKNA